MNNYVYKSLEGQKIIETFYKNILSDYKDYSFEQLFVNANGIKTHVLKFGNDANPPLIMLHGSVSNSAAWLGCINEFINDFLIFAIDIPGEPGLSEPNRLNLKSNQPAEWLSALLYELKIDKAFFLSMSMGSWYAINFASKNPERAIALSMITAGGLTPMKSGFIFKAILLTMLGNKGKKMINRLVYHKTEVPGIVLEFQSVASKYFKPVMGLPIFRDDEIKKLKMPLQFFGGECDNLINSVRTGHRLKALLPNSEINILNDTGHVIIDRFRDVKQFLISKTNRV